MFLRCPKPQSFSATNSFYSTGFLTCKLSMHYVSHIAPFCHRWIIMIQQSGFTSIEEVPLDEFLHPVMLKPHSDQPYVMSFKNWLQGWYLLGRQSAEGSSEPAQEDDDALLVSPEFLEGHVWTVGELRHQVSRDLLRRLAQRHRRHFRHGGFTSRADFRLRPLVSITELWG